MKVSGFTFVRNAVRLDYPVVEAIMSILPICDEVVVAVGNSSDATLALVQGIQSDKIRIIETVWDDTQREGGRVLAMETDKALQAVAPDADWCFYIQADEVLHEQHHAAVTEAMSRYKDEAAVEGLLFNYRHFYGSYDYLGSSWGWYRREIRVIRNDRSIFSYRDAQGFRRRPNNKLHVKLIDACIFHYGWVRDPRAMQEKHRTFNALWHDDQWIEQHVARADEFDYSNINSLERFEGTHPRVMQERIKRLNWTFDHDLSRNSLSFGERMKRLFSGLIGYRIGEYKNYIII